WQGTAALAFGGKDAHDRGLPPVFPGVRLMVICPIALAVHCVKCPIFNVCPVKSVIGDYKKPEGIRAEAADKAKQAAPARAPARKAQARKKKKR
ncbi:MAG: hypothetical protein ABI624_15735, partial [Casimicrobiaceae bacterium]